MLIHSRDGFRDAERPGAGTLRVKTAQENRYAWRPPHAGRRAAGRVRQTTRHRSFNPALGMGFEVQVSGQTQINTTQRTIVSYAIRTRIRYHLPTRVYAGSTTRFPTERLGARGSVLLP